MANKKSEKDNKKIDLQEWYERAKSFYEKRKNLVIAIVIVILGVPIGIWYYQSNILGPKKVAAAEKIFKAEYYFRLDSFELALKGRPGQFVGFLSIINQYGSTPTGNLAHYYAGICYLQTGQFQNAINHLKKYEGDDLFSQAMAYGCIGDSYSELDKFKDAVKYYKKAANASKNNFTQPMYWKKAALLYETALKQPKKALALYKNIRNNYGNTAEYNSIEKYIARLEAQLKANGK